VLWTLAAWTAPLRLMRHARTAAPSKAKAVAPVEAERIWSLPRLWPGLPSPTGHSPSSASPYLLFSSGIHSGSAAMPYRSRNAATSPGSGSPPLA
jgi:hypothetical protein